MNKIIWTCTSHEGKISKIQNASSAAILVGDKPLPTAKCTFTLFLVSHDSSEDISSIIIASTYLLHSTTIGEKRGPVSCVLGVTPTVPHDALVDICLMKMVEHEVALFDIECLGVALRLELQLNSFEETKELYDMSDKELLSLASQLKSEGVELFSKRQFTPAFQKFSRAIKYLILIDGTLYPTAQGDKEQLMCALKNNLVTCHVSTHSQNCPVVIQLCSEVLDKDAKNVKALYRRATAFLELQEYEKCRNDLLLAKTLEPSNSAVEVKFSLLDKQENQVKQKYKSAMQKMIS